MGYAAPAGGILCMELLKPTLPRPGSSNSSSHPGLTRAAIVQKLSLLLGFLDWIKPTAPNGDLCRECKVVIERVLDHTLNNNNDASPMKTSGGNDNGELLAAPAAEPLLGWGEPLPAALDFNFDLLDTFDWLRSDVNTFQDDAR